MGILVGFYFILPHCPFIRVVIWYRWSIFDEVPCRKLAIGSKATDMTNVGNIFDVSASFSRIPHRQQVAKEQRQWRNFTPQKRRLSIRSHSFIGPIRRGQ